MTDRISELKIRFRSRSVLAKKSSFGQKSTEISAAVFGVRKLSHYTFGHRIDEIAEYKPIRNNEITRAIFLAYFMCCFLFHLTRINSLTYKTHTRFQHTIEILTCLNKFQFWFRLRILFRSNTWWSTLFLKVQHFHHFFHKTMNKRNVYDNNYHHGLYFCENLKMHNGPNDITV